MQHRPLRKSFSEMSWPEQKRHIEAATGLPYPPDNASPEEYNQWNVAKTFLFYFRSEIYKADPAAAKAAAVNSLLKQSDYLVLCPYIEMALGRKLTETEITARRIA